MYLHKIIDELKYEREKWGIEKLSSFYLGGGTPSLISPEQLFELLNELNAIFEIKNIEMTAELNPESLSEEWLDAAIRGGINRFSCGVQTLDDKIRKIINRYGSSGSVLEKIELIKKTGAHLNVDLISGLPEQNRKRLLQDIDTIISYKPEHISFYDLSLEQDTILSQLVDRKIIHIPDDEYKDVLWESGSGKLKEYGYKRYEISAYCLPGNESRHNLAYWQMKSWLGIGAGAASSLRNKGQRYIRNNRESISNYLDGDKESWIEIKPEETGKDIIMMGLRSCCGFSLSDLFDCLDSGQRLGIQENIVKMQNLNYLKSGNNQIIPTEKGMNFHSFLVNSFFDYIP